MEKNLKPSHQRTLRWSGPERSSTRWKKTCYVIDMSRFGTDVDNCRYSLIYYFRSGGKDQAELRLKIIWRIKSNFTWRSFKF